MFKNKNISLLILCIIGCISGYFIGNTYPILDNIIKGISFTIINLLKLCILPYIIITLINSILKINDLKIFKSFIKYWLSFSIVGSIIGIVSTFIIKTNKLLSNISMSDINTNTFTIKDIINKFIPSNIIQSLYNYNIIHVIIICILIGIAIIKIKDIDISNKVKEFINICNIITYNLLECMLYLLPILVFCLSYNIVVELSLMSFIYITYNILCTYYTAVLLIIIFYILVIKYLCKMNIFETIKNIYKVILTAGTTCSSNITIPVTSYCCKYNLQIKEKIVNIITPIASIINMTSCCAEIPIYIIITMNLIGYKLTSSYIIGIFILGILMGICASGVPGNGSLEITVLQSVNLPLLIIPSLISIYRLIDIPSTILNVTSDVIIMKSIDLNE